MRKRLGRESGAVLEGLILRLPNAGRRKMFGHTTFFAGRMMFACLYGGGIAVRLSSAEARAAAATVREFRPHGRPMRNWVLLVYEDPRTAARDCDLLQQAAEIVQC